MRVSCGVVRSREVETVKAGGSGTLREERNNGEREEREEQLFELGLYTTSIVRRAVILTATITSTFVSPMNWC